MIGSRSALAKSWSSPRRRPARCDISHIGSEALLLGLLREQDGVAARALESLGVSLEKARLAVTRHVASGDNPVEGFIRSRHGPSRSSIRPATKARSSDHKYVGTEHILLALTTIEEGVGMNILRDFDLDATSIRDAVIERSPDPRHPNPPVASVRERDGDALPALRRARRRTRFTDSTSAPTTR